VVDGSLDLEGDELGSSDGWAESDGDILGLVDGSLDLDGDELGSNDG
jgi:hypothetical protein